jgi:hypothetical protein
MPLSGYHAVGNDTLDTRKESVMDDVKGLCSAWQSLLENFREVFTLGGWARFAQWITGMVLCSEEHAITQILTGLGLEDRWRNVESSGRIGGACPWSTWIGLPRKPAKTLCFPWLHGPQRRPRETLRVKCKCSPGEPREHL